MLNSSSFRPDPSEGPPDLRDYKSQARIATQLRVMQYVTVTHYGSRPSLTNS